jgi:hypothetical protein
VAIQPTAGASDLHLGNKLLLFRNSHRPYIDVKQPINELATVNVGEVMQQQAAGAPLASAGAAAWGGGGRVAGCASATDRALTGRQKNAM